jgi:potassium-transporting ATPase potassium-binding subunit
MDTGLWQVALGISLTIIMVPFIGTYFQKLISSSLPLPYENIYFRALSLSDGPSPQSFQEYCRSLIYLSTISLLALWALIMVGSSFTPGLAFEIAVSFVTNTNWQPYNPNDMYPWVQSVGLVTQQFISCAVSLSVAFTFIRSFNKVSINNFWQDLGRCIFYLLMPLSIIMVLIFIFQGAPQSINLFQSNSLPVAVQSVSKVLTSAGGGFTIDNAANILDNPTGLTNSLQIMMILLIPTSLFIGFGKYLNMQKTTQVLLSVILILFLISMFFGFYGELHNTVGKEARFGTLGSSFMTTCSTITSCGAVNMDLSKASPLNIFFATLNMMIASLGGVGSGFYTFILYVLLAVFFGSLMVGKGPVFGSKKLPPQIMTYVILAILTPAFLIFSMVITTLILYPDHSFTQNIYSATSLATGNGSSIGFYPDSLSQNLIESIVMLMGRFFPIYCVLKISDLLSHAHVMDSVKDSDLSSMKKRYKKRYQSPYISTSTPLFGVFLGSIIILVGGLLYLPPLAIGPYLSILSERVSP